MLSLFLVKLGFVDHANSLALHLPRMRQLHHLGHLLQSIEDVGLDFDAVLGGVIEHLLADFLSGNQGAFDVDVPEHEFLESHGYTVFFFF